MRKSLKLRGEFGPQRAARRGRIRGAPSHRIGLFGLTDFVSAYSGAILAAGVSVNGQFSHPLQLRAKLKIAAACHPSGTTRSHCAETKRNAVAAIAAAADRACNELHGRSSRRSFWQVLERAQRTGAALPADIRQTWFAAAPA